MWEASVGRRLARFLSINLLMNGWEWLDMHDMQAMHMLIIILFVTTDGTLHLLIRIIFLMFTVLAACNYHIFWSSIQTHQLSIFFFLNVWYYTGVVKASSFATNYSPWWTWWCNVFSQWKPAEPNTLFRSNSLASKSMESFLKVGIHHDQVCFFNFTRLKSFPIILPARFS